MQILAGSADMGQSLGLKVIFLNSWISLFWTHNKKETNVKKRVNFIIIKVNGNTGNHGSSKDSEIFEAFHFKIPFALFSKTKLLETTKFLNKYQVFENLLNESSSKMDASS